MDNFIVQLIARLDPSQAPADLKKIEQQLNAKGVNLKTVLDTSTTKAELKSLANQLQSVLKGMGLNIDTGTISSSINKVRSELNTLKGKSSTIALNVETGTYDAKVQSLITKTQQWTDANGNARISTTNLQNALQGLNAAYNNLNTGGGNAEAKQRALTEAERQLNIEIQKTTSQIKIQETQFATSGAVDTLRMKYETFFNTNGKVAKRWGTELKAGMAELAHGSNVPIERLRQLNAQLVNIQASARSAGITGATMWERFTAGIKKYQYYFSSMMVVMYAYQGIKNMITNVRDLDTALIDLKKTTSMTNSQLKEFYYTANDTAKQMGVTTKEIIEQASAWSRLGYNSYEAATQMAKYSAMFASISPGMSIDKATDGLVSVMKAFDIGNDNPEEVLDGIMSKINIIGNTAATSNDEIVDMLTRSSAAMREANNTLEETIALETAAVEITRDAESVGTAFKTVSMRIRGYDEETESYTNNVEELSGEIADLTKTASKPGGVSIFTDSSKTEFKSTYQIIKDISEIYDELTDKQQAGLLEAISGKRQGQIVAAAIQNFEAAEKAMENMANSAGSAEKEMAVIMDSVDYKANKLRETGVGIAQNLFKSEDMKSVLDTLNSLLGIIDKLTESFGLFGTIGLGVGIFKFGKIKSAIKELIKYQMALASSNGVQLTSWQALRAGIVSTTKIMLKSPLFWGTAAVVGITIISNAIKKNSEKIEESAQQAGEALEGFKSDMDELDDLIKQYNELQISNEWDNTSIETKKQLHEDINRLLGDEADKIDIINGKYKETTEELFKQRVSKLSSGEENKLAFDNERAKGASLWDTAYWNGGGGAGGYNYGTAQATESEKKFIEKYEKIFDKKYYSGGMGMGGSDYVVRFDNFDDLMMKYEETKEMLREMYNEGLGESELYKGLNSFIAKFDTKVSEYKTAVEELENAKANQELANYINSDVGGYIDNWEEYSDVIKWINQNFSEEDKDSALGFLNSYFSEYADMVDETTGNLNKMTVSSTEMEKASGNLSKIGSAFKEVSDNGYITTKTLNEIHTATGLSGSEWEEYENRLLNAKIGSSELNQTLSELTYKILENEFSTSGLINTTDDEISAIESKIAATLRENGVDNASAVAHDWLTKAKSKSVLATFDFKNATQEEIDLLYEELRGLGLTETAIGKLSKAYAEAQAAMLKAANTGALNRLKITQDELKGVKSVTDAYKLMAGKSYDINGDGVGDYSGSEKNRPAFDKYREQYNSDVETVAAIAKAQEEIDKIISGLSGGVVPDYSGADKSKSGSDKNEALDNYLKDAENRYKIHQDEIRYIQELQYAYKNLTKDEKERLDITGKINEAYRDLADNRIKDIEHQIDLAKELHDDDVDVTGYYNQIQNIAHQEANRLRAMGYDNNSDEIQSLQKTWWDAENSKLDFYTKQHENIIRDIEHARDMELKQNPYLDTTSYYKQMQAEYHKQAGYLRALDPEKFKEEIQELQQAWWDAQEAIVDWRWENSNRWIDERNTYNDWGLFDDSEIDAWERVIKWLNEEYPNDLEKIKEAEQNLFEARKNEFSKATDFGSTYLDSQKTILQSHFDVTNSIAEAQHEINKELETSKTMYEYLDEETRKLLFNQEDYNTLSDELLDIQYRADKLQRQYNRDLENATLETIESITSNYQMQYETLMKSYEIAKADLEVAKKKAKLNNVLNERNVRMFINGSWQWVANTEDVANAKSELADAEYAKRVEESGLTQQQSINNLTIQQDELGVVIKKFENGVIDLDDAVRLAKDAIGSMPRALEAVFSNVKINTSSSSGGISYSGSQGGSDWLADIYNSNDYAAGINSALAKGDVDSALAANKIRNEKIDYLGLDAEKWSDDDIKKRAKAHASGTRYTPGGLTQLGEKGFEAYIGSNGRLIPISQPTIGNIPSGGVVFNADQMKNLRTLWDMSNLNFKGGSLTTGLQQMQTNTSVDNRIIINGMTVDSGSADGQALISALRRYVGNH